jgi:hypothetical protein
MLSWSIFFPIIVLVTALLGFPVWQGQLPGLLKFYLGYSWSCLGSRFSLDGESHETS